MRTYEWIVAEGERETERVLQTELGLDPVIARLLVNRGATGIDKARLFLNAPLDTLLDPFMMKDMDKAVKRIILAMERKEKVVVFGDYDVDGVTATVTLLRFFTEIGISAEYYIPERATEGYGLNANALTGIKDGGAELVITVDNGMTAFDAIERANELKLDVIVTDHHQPGDKLPSAYAVLNPNRRDCGYPCKSLAGVGIAFKLCMAVRGKLHEKGTDKNRLPNLKRLLDVVAIGSIADMSQLKDENRTLVRHGLLELVATSKAGLQALKAISGVNGGAVTGKDIGFGLAPRLNAAGRLGRADIGVELLMTDDFTRAKQIAKTLDEENRRRRDIQQEMFERAEKMTLADADLDHDRAIVLGSDSWHAGVGGIVASKIMERFGLPVAIVSFDGDTGRGSARSIEGFNLFEALKLCSRHLERFGGHTLAAGFTLRRENFEKFKDEFLSVAKRLISDEDLRPKLNIDGVFDPALFDLKLVGATAALEPFGEGFARPIFASLGVKPSDIRTMGADGKHVRLTLGGGVEAVGFSMAEKFEKSENDSRYDIAFTPEINVWRGVERVQLRLIDSRPSNY